MTSTPQEMVFSVSSRHKPELRRVDTLLSYRVLLVAWTALWLFSYVHYCVFTGVHENLVVGLLNFTACYYLWLPLTPLLLRLEQRLP